MNNAIYAKHIMAVGSVMAGRSMIGASYDQSGWNRDDYGNPVYVVSAGETYGSIATKWLGSFRRYAELAKMQPFFGDSRHQGSYSLVFIGDALTMPQDAVDKAIGLGVLSPGTATAAPLLNAVSPDFFPSAPAATPGKFTIPEVVINASIPDPANPDIAPSTPQVVVAPVTPPAVPGAAPPTATDWIAWAKDNWQLCAGVGAGVVGLSIAAILVLEHRDHAQHAPPPRAMPARRARA